jgi:hypothetical protein
MTTNSANISPGPFQHEARPSVSGPQSIMAADGLKIGTASFLVGDRGGTVRQRANARLFVESWALLLKMKQICEAETRMPGNNSIAGLCDEARAIIDRIEHI